MTAAPHSVSISSEAGGRAWISAWGSLPIVAVVLYLVNQYVAPWVAPATPADAAGLFLTEYVGLCLPEKLEQLRYVLAIVVAPLAFAGAFIALSAVHEKVVTGLAVVGQTLLAAAVVYAWHGEQFDYFTRPLLITVTVISAGVYLALACWPTPVSGFFKRITEHRMRTAAVIVAFLATCAYVSPTITPDSEVYLGPAIIWHHLEFTAGEYFAVAAGSTPLVDFFPQYNNVLPLLLAPVFWVTGYTLLSYTVLMAGLSLAGLMAIFWALQQLTGNTPRALFLYLPIVGFGLYFTGPPEYAPSAFNYFAVWPMRFVWPMCSLGLLAWVLRAPTLIKWAALGGFAGVGALNNIDFGVPAAAGCLAALVLSRPPAVLRSAAAFLFGCVFAACAIAFAFFLRSGAWPNVPEATTFSKIFALYGFMMLPLPKTGLYWVVYLSYMGCLFVAIARWFCGSTRSTYSGLLAFASVFGSGSLMYYVGRSHTHVLIALFVPWALACTLLLHGLLQGLSTTLGSKRRYLIAIPGMLLAFHQTLFAANLVRSAEPIFAQGERRKLRDVEGAERETALRAFVVENVQSSEAVVLAFPLPQKVLGDSAPRNVYPFPHPGSIILKAQAAKLRDALKENEVNKLFISAGWDGREDVYRILTKHGLRHVGSAVGVNYWARAGDGPIMKNMIGTTVEFGEGGNAVEFRESGWSGPETGMSFTWSEGKSAKLTLPVSMTTRPLKLKMTMGGLTSPPDLPFQPVEVYANGQKVADLQVGPPAEYEAPIPAELVNASSDLTVELRIPRAASPKELGHSADARVLGVYVSRMKLTY